MNTNDISTTAKQAIDSLTVTFFEAVSFQVGGKPAYQNLYGLFIDCGLLIKNSSTSPEITTVSQFIEPRQRSVDSGELTAFRESETAEITEIFGNVAHRFSTYEKHGVSHGAEFAGRGIISIQFVKTETTWKMSCMAWDDERPGLAIPERYLSNP
ncbi:MAG TPA: hypothetical protein VKQ72_15430 [Aggregatilineales bacterium]|nr:hypothetical protein [Aggregatilineales bacterium]